MIDTFSLPLKVTDVDLKFDKDKNMRGLFVQVGGTSHSPPHYHLNYIPPPPESKFAIYRYIEHTVCRLLKYFYSAYYSAHFVSNLRPHLVSPADLFRFRICGLQ